MLENINWLAVIVGTIASFIAGWLWYSDTLFGKKWRVGVGLPENMEDMDGFPAAAMASQLLGTLILAVIIGITASSDSLFLAILITAAIIVFGISAGLYAKKQATAIIIESGYFVVMLVIMVIVQGLL